METAFFNDNEKRAELNQHEAKVMRCVHHCKNSASLFGGRAGTYNECTNKNQHPNMKALLPIFKTDNGIDALLLRITLGVAMFPHGAQKVLGWFGGYGFSGTMTAFTQNMQIPTLFAFLAIAAEFAGALGVIVGLTTRVAAFGIGVTMAVAASMHWQHGFFMNWYGNQKGEGFEYHLLAIGIALVLMIRGGGRFSLDRVVTRKLESDTEVTEREEVVLNTVN